MSDSSDIPPVVYHYCNADGFHGILASKQLWLSDVRFMNDTTEQTHFITKVQKLLQDLLPGPDSLFVELLIKNFEWMRLTPFACCFCENGDLLSQWCRYADDGKGFAVGFSSEWLRNQRRKYAPRHPLVLSGVEYDDERQLTLATTCIDEYLKEVRGLGREGRQDVSMRAIARLWVLSAVCKDHNFHEEKEVRLILTEVTDPKSATQAAPEAIGVSPTCHRLRGTQNVPYFRLGFSEEAVAEIRLGPKSREREDRNALEKFLKSNGYDLDQVRIELSRVPYR